MTAQFLFFPQWMEGLDLERRSASCLKAGTPRWIPLCFTSEAY